MDMRVNEKNRYRKLNSPGITKESTQIGLQNEKEFPGMLDKFQSGEWEGDIEEVLRSLDEIGGRLVNSFSIYDLKNYKEILKNFLKKTRGKVYRIKENTVRTRRGKTSILQIIEKIDNEMDELSRLVLSQQKDRVKILERIDLIRGLLVDLYS